MEFFSPFSTLNISCYSLWPAKFLLKNMLIALWGFPYSSQVVRTGKSVLLGPTGHLLHKATPSKLGEVVVSPNIERLTQRVGENVKTEEFQTKN